MGRVIIRWVITRMLANITRAEAKLKKHLGVLQAVQAGFKDFSHMRRDADLQGMREHPMYRALIEP